MPCIHHAYTKIQLFLINKTASFPNFTIIISSEDFNGCHLQHGSSKARREKPWILQRPDESGRRSVVEKRGVGLKQTLILCENSEIVGVERSRTSWIHFNCDGRISWIWTFCSKKICIFWI